MDPAAVLTAFDEQVRRRPEPDPPDGRVEDDGHVVRMVGAVNTVVWSDLDGTDVDAVIADQVRRFAGRPWEWKHYSYDRPADLPERLLAAGLTRQEDEALLVADVADLAPDVKPPPGVELRAVEDEHDVATFVDVHDEVFGGDHSDLGAVLLANLTQRPDRAAAVIAWAEGTPVSAARIEFHTGTDFASLWGGGTIPAWRGRGVFRSLVAHRAALARARGFRHLQVDALPASRPILRRLGFTELATTTPFTA
ncbi:MAG TPA: GNAT family N-acetyltransferase [Actinoallomurus sp.]|jgi:GNAT superfamily N-acetyltransferase|nr:GNAT family N-acetyltransferase [Actinoallomurus sp.]